MINLIKKKLRKLLTIRPKETGLIEELKKKFRHEKRSFTHKYYRLLVDCLYCHASPGVLESTILEVVKLKPAKNKTNLLNLGGGTGQVSDIFKFLGYEVFNLDLDILPQDENAHNLRYDLNNTEALPFPQKYFDVVLCQEIIEHIENPWKLLRDAKSVVKDDGLIIISTPNIQSSWSRLKFFLTGYFPWFSPNCFSYHINPLFAWEIRLICEKIGLNINQIKGNGDYFFSRGNSNLDNIIKNNEELIYFLTSIKQN